MGEIEETRTGSTGRARGLVSSRRSGRRVEAGTALPAAAANEWVELFWWGRWDLRGQESHTTELLGSPCVHLVFEDGDGVAPHGRVVGVWTHLWTRTLTGRGRVRGVKLRAGAAKAVLGVSAHRFTNRIVPLGEVGLGPDLVDAVLSPADDDEGFAALWNSLPEPGLDAHALRAVRAVRTIETSGVTRVDALAAREGISVRGLQQIFREHVGASPKWVLRRERLREVATRVESGTAPDLADLALTLGYADQAHLARDFRAATGKTLRGFESSVHDRA